MPFLFSLALSQPHMHVSSRLHGCFKLAQRLHFRRSGRTSVWPRSEHPLQTTPVELHSAHQTTHGVPASRQPRHVCDFSIIVHASSATVKYFCSAGSLMCARGTFD